MYNVWLCLEKKYGWVLSAYYSYMAGLGSAWSHVGSAWSHVAALLFKIESTCHLKLTEGISPTGVLCQWKKSKKSAQPVLIKFVNFSLPRKH